MTGGWLAVLITTGVAGAIVAAYLIGREVGSDRYEALRVALSNYLDKPWYGPDDRQGSWQAVLDQLGPPWSELEHDPECGTADPYQVGLQSGRIV